MISPRIDRIVKKYRTASDDTSISMITCYDYPTAKILDEAGIDAFLVGDSLGTNVLGYQSVLEVTMADMVHHTKAVARGTKNALVVVDLPAHSCDTVELALKNGRLLMDAGADMVKIELEQTTLESMKALSAVMPVCAHIGYTPQSTDLTVTAQGKEFDRGIELISLAIEAQKAGAVMLVMELVPAELAEHITLTVDMPTIGIGCGPWTTGQVQVFYDIMGYPEKPFRHAKAYVDLPKIIRDAAEKYADEISHHKFPGADNAPHIDAELKERYLAETMKLLVG